MKGKGRAWAHSVHKSSGLKKLVRGAANKRCRTVARQAVQNTRVQSHVFDLLKKRVQKELIKQACMCRCD